VTSPEADRAQPVSLSRSQRNLYNGVLQDGDPALYLIGKSYRFHPLGLSQFLAALEATIHANPVALCVLEAPAAGAGYPDLVPRLRVGDLVRVTADGGDAGGGELTRGWSSGLLGKPLVRFTVRTDESGRVSGLDVHTHHILLDGGATGIIEADLARYLAADGLAELPSVSAGLARLAEAHRGEADKVEESLRRVAPAVQRELADDARRGGAGLGGGDSPATASQGVLHESVRVCGDAFEALLAFSEAKQVPLNVLVAAAAVAVDASIRQSTEGLLVHTVDNRFGNPDLNVATCLVNSVGHPVRFAPFASVADVVAALDRGYVKALRRRWLREEHYRRMWLAINRTTHVAALTLNFIREACVPDLRPFLCQAPVATAIGPVEGMTVACVLDEGARTLDCAIWNRGDLPQAKTPPGVAARIAAALASTAALWDLPIAMTVDDWFGIGPDGSRRPSDAAHRSPHTPAAAWFLDTDGGVPQFLGARRQVRPWVAWLVRNGVAPGDVLVFADDDTDKTVDLLIACHLAGCGYSVCDDTDDAPRRASVIADHGGGAPVHVVDVAAAALAPVPGDEVGRLVDARIEDVARDPALAGRTAYIMPTSGTTGQPKLVPIPHAALAAFCDAAHRAYGWGPRDTILQCAPLTSDISVEEVFGAAISGAVLVRSTATRDRDLDALASDLVDQAATVIDLPTAVWHLLCQDAAAIEAIRGSQLRQIVVGGEPIRPDAVDSWLASVAAENVSLISTYGPTEATVVATQLPIADGETALAAGDRLRVGRPLIPDTVFVAFGEIVIVGDLVASGYVGTDGPSFGTVLTAAGVRRRALATADRVTLDTNGFPVFAGRRDALVKISGRRVDTAVVSARIRDDPAVADAAVESHDGSLGVWFETQRTRDGHEDAAAAARIRRILVNLRVPSFFVVGVPVIPRKPSGKIDGDRLRMTTGLVDTAQRDTGPGDGAAGLADVWGRHLGRSIGPETSLLEEGVGSLDLIRILPPTREYLGRPLTVLDLIGADTAANLVCDLEPDAPAAGGWPDTATASEIERDLARALRRRPGIAAHRRGRSILVLGASGILGTGFARAAVEMKRSGLLRPEVVLATRATLPQRDWAELRGVDGVRVEQLPAGFGPADLDDLLGGCGVATVVNCAGNTNMLAPYRDIRPANVDLVAAAVDACAHHGTRLVQLSTFVVNADVTAPRVTDPRRAPYPYAASKSLAELAVAGSPHGLEFTVVRLPRVLGEGHQLRDTADVLVSVVDACIASGAYPTLTLTEEVTTARAAARAILGLLPESAGPAEPGRGITVVHGEQVSYTELLGGYALDELEVTEWKRRLDQSNWARMNPRRWSVVDAWVSLGMQLGGRRYTEYLAEAPTIALGLDHVAELSASPPSIRSLLAQDFLSRRNTLADGPAGALVDSPVGFVNGHATKTSASAAAASRRR